MKSGMFSSAINLILTESKGALSAKMTGGVGGQ